MRRKRGFGRRCGRRKTKKGAGGKKPRPARNEAPHYEQRDKNVTFLTESPPAGPSAGPGGDAESNDLHTERSTRPVAFRCYHRDPTRKLIGRVRSFSSSSRHLVSYRRGWRISERTILTRFQDEELVVRRELLPCHTGTKECNVNVICAVPHVKYNGISF